LKQIKQILLTGILLFCIVPLIVAQNKKRSVASTPLKKVAITAKPAAKTVLLSEQAKAFQQITAQADVYFKFPKGFRETKAPNNEDFSFDYGVELPGKEFEVWYQVRSQKENFASYERSINNKNNRLANPDSTYISLGSAVASSLTGDHDFVARNIPAPYLVRYNADAGKSYLLNLQDMAITKRYKYALLITLQKDRTGSILAVAFTNEKGPEFFKNINRAGSSIRFKD
jgi:hypothetical protein